MESKKNNMSSYERNPMNIKINFKELGQEVNQCSTGEDLFNTLLSWKEKDVFWNLSIEESFMLAENIFDIVVRNDIFNEIEGISHFFLNLNVEDYSNIIYSSIEYHENFSPQKALKLFGINEKQVLVNNKELALYLSKESYDYGEIMELAEFIIKNKKIDEYGNEIIIDWVSDLDGKIIIDIAKLLAKSNTEYMNLFLKNNVGDPLDRRDIIQDALVNDPENLTKHFFDLNKMDNDISVYGEKEKLLIFEELAKRAPNYLVEELDNHGLNDKDILNINNIIQNSFRMVDKVSFNNKVKEFFTEGNKIVKNLEFLIIENRFEDVASIAKDILADSHMEMVEKLNGKNSSDVVLLAEAVNLAAKILDEKFYSLKPALVVAASQLGAFLGVKNGIYIDNYGDEHAAYPVYYLLDNHVGVASFHDPGGNIAHLYSKISEDEVPEWEHEWSGIPRQEDIFELIKSKFGDKFFLKEMAYKTLPGEGSVEKNTIKNKYLSGNHVYKNQS